MKKIIMTLSMAAMCLCLTDIAMAGVPVPQTLPFLKISVDQKNVFLGSATGPGVQPLFGQMTANVKSNIPFIIEANFNGFKQVGGHGMISPDGVLAYINGQRVGNGHRRAEIIYSPYPTGPLGVMVPMDLYFEVINSHYYKPGTYEGVISLYIAPAV